MTRELTADATDVANSAKELYASEPRMLVRLAQTYRPAIAPLEHLVSQVPRGSRVLDVGCGAGLVLLLLAKHREISTGFGFDVSDTAIESAREATRRARLENRLQFERRRIEDGLPTYDADVLTVVDVLHHVPPQSQRSFVQTLFARVPKGGRLVIKDMAAKPAWRAAANRAHDLLMARQWVHHVDATSVVDWARDTDLRIVDHTASTRLWYGHWSLTLVRA
jgi:cyclopropane fatty-acyl-phospholipid synthase-like methyltransferase